MILEPVDPNARFRERRKRAQRRRKLRRTAFLLALLVAAVSGGVIVWATGRGPSSPVEKAVSKTSTKPAASKQNPLLPKEIRGIHVTMGLASLPGKLDQYIDMKEEGLNTIALDVKDEYGVVAFSIPDVPMVSEVGADGGFYRPAQVVKQIHEQGIYLIGRVVVFEDPVLSTRRPDLAIQRSDGSRWLDIKGLGWTNQYDTRVWEYNVAIAKAAAKAGFDEIQFDYTRFPTDGPVESAVWPVRRNESRTATITRFLRYALKQLKPLGVRVSVDVFGLAATNNMGIGQSPKALSRIVDAICPMVYPSHFGSGQFGLDDPEAVPGTTVGYALSDFMDQMRGGRAELVPWIQDFSLKRKFTLTDIQDEILAVRRSRVRGYLLWNPLGNYTPGTLRPAPGG